MLIVTGFTVYYRSAVLQNTAQKWHIYGYGSCWYRLREKKRNKIVLFK